MQNPTKIEKNVHRLTTFYRDILEEYKRTKVTLRSRESEQFLKCQNIDFGNADWRVTYVACSIAKPSAEPANPALAGPHAASKREPVIVLVVYLESCTKTAMNFILYS